MRHELWVLYGYVCGVPLAACFWLWSYTSPKGRALYAKRGFDLPDLSPRQAAFSSFLAAALWPLALLLEGLGLLVRLGLWGVVHGKWLVDLALWHAENRWTWVRLTRFRIALTLHLRWPRLFPRKPGSQVDLYLTLYTERYGVPPS